MFYGVEQSTDLRRQRTVVEKFTTEKALKKWINEKNGDFTYSDPHGARNYHRTFRYGYEVIGRINKKDPLFKYRGTNTYPRNSEDNLASYVYKYGRELDL
jgi:acyl-CoA synthetase (AMP-forming)/AMP-acid ligase II